MSKLKAFVSYVVILLDASLLFIKNCST